MKLKQFFVCLCVFAIIVVTFSFFRISTSSGVTKVEGWDLKTSKNVKDYISEKQKPHIIPDNFCNKQEDLLVMVQSRPSSFEARSAIRATWGQKRDNVSFVFLLGEVKDNPSLQSEVELESITFGDIIQERFIDHYNNLTLKSISMLKLFNLHCAKSYKYLIKVDDDIFLNIRLVMRMLSKRTSSKDLLLGRLLNNTGPFRDTSNKWFVPYELYPEEKYPDYLCGATYLMSSDVAQKLYRCALETPIFYIEDVYITGICAKKVNVTPKHDSRFTCHTLPKDFCLHRELYSIHYYTPERIRSSYQLLENNECASRAQSRLWIWNISA